MFDQEQCSLRLLLVEDFPGGHTYVHVCRYCAREYGEEFTVYHHPTAKTPNDPIPEVSPQPCPRRERGSLRATRPEAAGFAPARLAYA